MKEWSEFRTRYGEASIWEQATIDAGMLRRLILDPDLRSISFDLHLTLVSPRSSRNEHIYRAFCRALEHHGFANVVKAFEAEQGYPLALQLICEASDHFHLFLDEVLEHSWDSIHRWHMTNATILEALLERYEPGAPPAQNDPWNHRLESRVYAEPFQRTLGRATPDIVATMSREIRLGISGSQPDDWEADAREIDLVDLALKRGLHVFIWSNGTQSSVEACSQRWFPGIPRRHVFTPDRLAGTGKPAWESVALFWFNAQIVRLPSNTYDGEWERCRAKATKQLFRELKDDERVFRAVQKAYRHWCRRFGLRVRPLPSGATHLHVGNSDYHDDLQYVGPGPAFYRGLYKARKAESPSD